MKPTAFKGLNLNTFKSIFLVLFFLGLTACSSDDNGLTASQPSGAPPWDSREACDNQQYNVGIPGNIYCPYRGQTINGRVEAFAAFEWNGAIYLDFGLQYNDACPAGEVPVYAFEYGQRVLKRCDYIGEDYVDVIFFQHHNSSSCAGGYAGDKNCIPGSI